MYKSVDIAKKDLIAIINEEVDKILNEAPDFTRRRPRFSDDDTTDIILKKNLLFLKILIILMLLKLAILTMKNLLKVITYYYPTVED